MCHRGTQEKLRSLKYCTSFRDLYFCIKQVLSYIIDDVPRSRDNYWSLDNLIEDCGIVPEDSDWSIDWKLWYIAYCNDTRKSIRELLMAFLSLRWLHEDDSNFDRYDTSPQEHTYKNRVRVWDTVLYYLRQRHFKPHDMPPFSWLKQFEYTISVANDLERFLEPPLTGDEIRSIYAQSFPPHYRIALINAGSYPLSSNHMDDIMEMTNFFATTINFILHQKCM